jgi:hypothetical protein
MRDLQENLSLPGMEEPQIAFTKLRPVHEKFCREFAKHGVGTKAYLAVYPQSEYGNARSRASELLRKPMIQLRLNELAQEIDHELRASVVGYHRQVMQQDRAAYFREDGKVKPILEMTEEERRIVDIEAKVVDGTLHYLPVFGTRKQSAEAIAKIKGMVSDKLELTGKDGVPLGIEVTFVKP